MKLILLVLGILLIACGIAALVFLGLSSFYYSLPLLGLGAASLLIRRKLS